MNRLTSFSVFVLALSAWGCASSPAPSVASPEPTTPTKPTPTAEKEEPPAADRLYAPDDATPSAPPSCVAGAPLPSSTSCGAPEDRLAAALRLSGSERDAALGALETCSELPRGAIRTLRAELGPAECADTLLAAVVSPDSPALDTNFQEHAVALALGARLHRLARTPPAPPAERDRATLESYFAGTLFPWVNAQANSIFAIMRQGAALHGLAKGIVAIEAGMADMRFVEIARAVPVPKEIESDAELRDVYYGALDEALEPRKARGRDAALVGLREFAAAGILRDARVTEARLLLGRVFGGGRATALDRLLVPSAPIEDPKRALPVLGAPFSALLPQTEGDRARTSALLRHSIPVGERRRIEASGSHGEKLELARALVESGRIYFRSEDFQAAAALLGALLDGDGPGTWTQAEAEDARFLRALSIALSAGPKDAVELLAKGPRFADALGNLALLDALGEGTSKHAGLAAFDAAYLRELVAPPGNPDAWKELAARYKKASARLAPAEKKLAEERARAAAQTEKELRKPAPAATR